MGRRLAAVLVALLGLMILPAHAGATFPGQPGLLIGNSRDRTTTNDHEIYTSPENGGTRTQLTDNDVDDLLPDWSADGQKIAYIQRVPPESTMAPEQLWVMNADGSGQHQVGPAGIIGTFPSNLSWSPDGSRIAYTHWNSHMIHTISADGTGDTTLGPGNYPEWAPDGSRIAFYRDSHIWTMNPDGSGAFEVAGTSATVPDWSPDSTRITFQGAVVDADGQNRVTISCGTPAFAPFWSPDGYKIAVGAFLVNPDGTNCDRPVASGSDWQPIVGSSGLVRPKGASPLRVPLVPAYVECIDPGLKHGPPLAEDSCGPPVQRTTRLTVGTPDANEEAANSIGSVRLGVQPGIPAMPPDEADVSIAASVADVRDQGSLTDYTGELGVSAGLRIADRDNSNATSGLDPGTTMDATLAFAVPCSATSSTAIGSTCELQTTFDTLVPGAVKESQRAVWGLGAVGVLDGGADGDADTADGDALFLTQGIFIP